MKRCHPVLRKNFRNGFLLLAFICIAFCFCHCSSEPKKGPLAQGPLPYPEDALEPYISAKALRFHYGKHHAGYIAETNSLIQGSSFNGKTLEEIIRATSGEEKHTALFNSAAQAWNHAFFWESLKPKGGGKPKGVLKRKIEENFGSTKAFREEIQTSAEALFGSGWIWLVMDQDKLRIVTTSNADTPIAHGQKPLLTIDLWEHAYYLDYQNRRSDYVAKVLKHLIDWDRVSARLK